MLCFDTDDDTNWAAISAKPDVLDWWIKKSQEEASEEFKNIFNQKTNEGATFLPIVDTESLLQLQDSSGGGTSPLDSPGEFAGQTINYNGQTYSWNGSEWQNQTPDPSFGLSDKRLKKNIESIGVSDSGINIYTFEYADEKHGKGRYKGVMAQEVPWATIPLDSGYLAVDYNKIDVDFERVN